MAGRNISRNPTTGLTSNTLGIMGSKTTIIIYFLDLEIANANNIIEMLFLCYIVVCVVIKIYIKIVKTL